MPSLCARTAVKTRPENTSNRGSLYSLVTGCYVRSLVFQISLTYTVRTNT